MKNTNKNIAAAFIISGFFFVPVFCSAQTDKEQDPDFYTSFVDWDDIIAQKSNQDAFFDMELEELSTMRDMISLRLQMTMDRRSKFISTLSQIIKKISAEQDLLIQNAK